MDSAKAPSPAGANPSPPPSLVIVVAALLWVGVDLIGDGLLATLELLGARTPSASPTASPERLVTPS